MKILVLGDVHACWFDLNQVIAKAFNKHPNITHIIQVGDWGYAFPGVKPFTINEAAYIYADQDPNYRRAKQTPFYWLDGNHENFDQLDEDKGAWQSGMTYMPRGSVATLGDKRAMFFGGAASIDKQYRIEHISWWPQETMSESQIKHALSQPGPIDIMFSHDYPLACKYSQSYKGEFGRREREALEIIRQHFKPRFAIFGHHHEFDCGENDGTLWACSPIIESHEYLIWDGDSIIHEI
jgi:predicted phosphodiesterase